jgi:hypothetical protein
VTDETTKDAGLETPDSPPDGIEPVGTEAAVDDERDGGAALPRRRGSIAIYAAAFGLMVLAAVGLMIGALGILSIVNVAETSFFGTQRILRISAVLSGLAIVAAVVAVLVPRRSS